MRQSIEALSFRIRNIAEVLRRRSVSSDKPAEPFLPFVDPEGINEFQVAFSILGRMGFGNEELLREAFPNIDHDDLHEIGIKGFSTNVESLSNLEQGDIRISLRHIYNCSDPSLTVMRNIEIRNDKPYEACSQRVLAEVGRFSSSPFVSGPQSDNIQIRLLLLNKAKSRRVYLLLTGEGITIQHSEEGQAGVSDVNKYDEYSYGRDIALWFKYKPNEEDTKRGRRLLQEDWKITPKMLSTKKVDIFGTIKALMETPISEGIFNPQMIKST